MDPAGPQISPVRYELEADAGETILRLTHRRSVAPAAIGGRAGWHAYLDCLAAHLDGLAIPDGQCDEPKSRKGYAEAPLQGA